MAPLNIAIIGGGIAGPCAAIGLAQNGHRVTIYERATTSSGVGYAFRITPNSNRCLRVLGIDTEDAGAVLANSNKMMDSDGNVVMQTKENIDLEKAKKGASVFAYRPSVQRQLMDRVKEVGVEVKTDSKVTSVDVEQTSMTFASGTTVSADLIIAADGVHSSVRPYIVDANAYQPKLSTGHNCLRFTIPKETMLNDPLVSEFANDDIRMFTWKGAEKRIIGYAVDYDRLYNITCTHPATMSNTELADGGGEDAVAYNHKISPTRAKEIYSEFAPEALRLLDLADPDGFRVWPILDMDEIPRWSSARTALIGDACHPVVPFGFSGAGMAIEDAVTLAILLDQDVRSEELRSRLDLWEEMRRPRVGRVRDTSRALSNSEDMRMIKEYRAFLSDFDAVDVANEVLEKERKSRHQANGNVV